MSIILNSEKLDTIVKIIELNDELIQYDYKGKENQILIPKSLVQKLSTHMLKINIKGKQYVTGSSRVEAFRKHFLTVAIQIALAHDD